MICFIESKNLSPTILAIDAILLNSHTNIDNDENIEYIKSKNVSERRNSLSSGRNE